LEFYEDISKGLGTAFQLRIKTTLKPFRTWTPLEAYEALRTRGEYPWTKHHRKLSQGGEAVPHIWDDHYKLKRLSMTQMLDTKIGFRSINSNG